MIVFTTQTEFEAWAQYRLAEMDAGLTAMEAEPALESTPAGHALSEARAARERFAAGVRAASDRKLEAPFRASAAVQDAWTRFETEMENWAVAAERTDAAFDARARALFGVWHAAAATYRAQAAAAGIGRSEIEAAVAGLERDAARHGAKFEALKAAGRFSWLALGEALRESRAVFERTATFTPRRQ